MNSFRSEPFLWIHLAGLVVVPVSLLLVWLGLAAGDPAFPVFLEVGFLAIAGIVPIAWMQWQRPFDIFSLLVVSVRPDLLTPEQRQILCLLKSLKVRVANIIVAVLMVWVIWQIYHFAPLAAIATPLSPRWHLLGLILAAIAFFLSNLFVQVPVSVIGVLLTPDSRFTAIEPYEVENIGRDFFIVGLRTRNFLPFSSTSTSIENQSVNPLTEESLTQEETIPDSQEEENEKHNDDIWEDEKQTVDKLDHQKEQPNDNMQNEEIIVSENTESQAPEEAEKTAEDIIDEKLTPEYGEAETIADSQGEDDNDDIWEDDNQTVDKLDNQEEQPNDNMQNEEIIVSENTESQAPEEAENIIDEKSTSEHGEGETITDSQEEEKTTKNRVDEKSHPENGEDASTDKN